MRASTRRSSRHSRIPALSRATVRLTRLEGNGSGRARAARQWAESFDLFGHSMGGRVALEVFRLAPERVRRLARCRAPACTRCGEGEPAKRRALLGDRARRQGFEALVDTWLPPMVAEANRVDDRSTAQCGRCASMPASDTFDAQINAQLARPEQESLLPQIACPTLVHDRRARCLEPARAARSDRRCQIADSTLVIVPRCGAHAPARGARSGQPRHRRLARKPGERLNP